MRVCLVDDDPILLDLLENMVAEAGHQPVPAPDVRSALGLLADGIDAAVVDMLMPEQDGVEFIMAARRAYPKLRIVAISGGGRVGTGALLAMARGLGADAVLAKPFSASDLKTALRI